MLGLMHAVNADPGQAPGMMLYSSLAYTAASAFAGFPFYVPAAIWRYGAFALGLKKIFEAKNFKNNAKKESEMKGLLTTPDDRRRKIFRVGCT